MLRDKVGHDELILNYAGCIIFDDKNRLLLQKRTDCEKWGFLGGMVELGESVAESAVREIREESGLDVELTSLFGVYSKYFEKYSNGDKAQTVVHVFRVTGIIRTRFLQADFRQYCVKILANPLGFAPFLPCLVKNPLCKKSPTLKREIFIGFLVLSMQEG